MCNQREKLIGYVYDECEPAERAAVQGHLETCPDCRTEIAALRSVRSDLQSWQVPDHESVWRPFAPAPAPSWWQQVPRWAMAAAASVVMMSGAAGGAAAYMVLGQQPVQASQPAAVQPISAVTVNEVNALEQRLRTLVKVEVDRLNSQVQLASSRPAVQMSADQAAAFHTAFDRQLSELRATNDNQVEAINAIYNKLGRMQLGFDLRHELLKTRVTDLASAMGER
jgi:anti-sigma factor RsiW